MKVAVVRYDLNERILRPLFNEEKVRIVIFNVSGDGFSYIIFSSQEVAEELRSKLGWEVTFQYGRDAYPSSIVQKDHQDLLTELKEVFPEVEHGYYR